MSDNPSTAAPDDKRQGGLPSWAVKTIALAVVAVLAVIAYFVLAALLPRWWSQKIGSAVDQSITTGSLYGIAFGVVCTLVSLLLLVLAWRARRWGQTRYWALAFVVLAVVASIPNLLTLTVVVGRGSGAHAGERILDVEAPGFRGGTLVGVIIAAVIFVVGALLRIRLRHRRSAPTTTATTTERPA
ncbi:permease [Gordonia oryzae]|uniref:Permease n=1 Tax=Gordonia oryzae TaxID=2487349 RepID=A0A3N4GCM3_9ACTN|nr:permease [Gordonia oryzae]RPA58316.1 permease [Gordonia oryzae]